MNWQFKLFTFSRLLAKYTISQSMIQLVIFSPIHESIRDLMENVLWEGMRIGNQFFID